MASSRSTANRAKSDVRRTLFRSLSRSNKSSNSTTAAAAAAASSSRAHTGVSGYSFEDDDGIVVRNDDGSIDVQVPTVLSQAGVKDFEHEDHRLAELVKRHNNDMARKLPEVELLRAQVASLANDNWMFEAEDD